MLKYRLKILNPDKRGSSYERNEFRSDLNTWSDKLCPPYGGSRGAPCSFCFNYLFPAPPEGDYRGVTFLIGRGGSQGGETKGFPLLLGP